MLELGKERVQTSFPSRAEVTLTLVSLKRKVRECDLRKEPKVCGPNFSDPLSLGTSVSLCGSVVHYVGEQSRREVL